MRFCAAYRKCIFSFVLLAGTSAWAGDHSPGGVVGGPTLPLPATTHYNPPLLTLKDAIWLALRNNPDVISSELDRVIDKYNLQIGVEAYDPKYTLSASATRDFRDRKNNYSVGPGTTLTSRIGTQYSVDVEQTRDGNTNYTQGTFKLTQPLLRGGWSVAGLPYDTTLDNEKIARLTFKGAMMGAVKAVITAYRTLVGDYTNLSIQEKSLSNGKESLRQIKLRYQEGRASKSDYIQQKSTYETTRLSAVRQQQTIRQDYATLLKAIGLKSSARIRVSKTVTNVNDQVPTLKESIDTALKSNVSYQKSVINYRNLERGVQTAKNDQLWQLDLTGKDVLSSDATPDPSVSLKLDVPIEDTERELKLVQAKIALEKARLKLEEEKQDLIRTVTNQWEDVSNEKEQLKVSQALLDASRLNLKYSRLRYQYGRSTAFEVSQNELTLLSHETNLVTQRLSLLNAITTLQQTLGRLLHFWNIKLRY